MSDFNDKDGMIRLRRLFDPKGLLLHKNNTRAAVCRTIRGSALEKHYTFLEQAEEYAMRQSILNNKDCKLILKY